MLCRLVSTYVVRSLALPPGVDLIPVYVNAQDRVSAVLLREPDEALADADRGACIGELMLGAMFQASDAQATSQHIATVVERIAEERRRKASQAPYLITTIECDVDPDLEGPNGILPTFSVYFDAIDKERIRKQFSAQRARVVSAVAVALDGESRIDQIGDSVYLVRDDGHVIYSLSFHGHAAGLSVRQVQPDLAARVPVYVDGLRKARTDLSTVLALLTAATDGQTEPLRAFISAWSALEIFTAKVFATYEERWFQRLLDRADSAEHPHLEAVRAVMVGKYSLLAKFSVLALWLAPKSAASDTAEFSRLKKLRDGLLHGGGLTRDVSAAEAVLLLRRYLRLHLGA